MRKCLSWTLLVIFTLVGFACVGCAKKRENPAAEKALHWKKAKENELSGDNADKGE